jgi:hypothetical protein
MWAGLHERSPRLRTNKKNHGEDRRGVGPCFGHLEFLPGAVLPNGRRLLLTNNVTLAAGVVHA